MTATRAIVLVDHGSRRPEANAHTERIAAMLAQRRPDWIVGAAHLELHGPRVPEVVDACVGQGAREVVLYPFFLLPGRHTTEDLPALAEDARRRHPEVAVRVADTLGLDPRLVDLVLEGADAAIAVGAGCAQEDPPRTRS